MKSTQRGKKTLNTEQNKVKTKQKQSATGPLRINLCNMAVGIFPFFLKNAVQLWVLDLAFPLRTWSSVAAERSSFHLLLVFLWEQEFLLSYGSHLLTLSVSLDLGVMPRAPCIPIFVSRGPAIFIFTSPISACILVRQKWQGVSSLSPFLPCAESEGAGGRGVEASNVSKATVELEFNQSFLKDLFECKVEFSLTELASVTWGCVLHYHRGLGHLVSLTASSNTRTCQILLTNSGMWGKRTQMRTNSYQVLGCQ